LVSASIGIAAGNADRAPDQLLREADIALYQAKDAGKRCAMTFAPTMQTSAQVHRKLAVDLEAALEEKQFFLLYQPTIDLQTGDFRGVEALLRWQHPEEGVIQPDDFIPELEASGLIVPVGAWVLEEACRQGAAWVAAGHRFSVSVNVSAKQIISTAWVGPGSTPAWSSLSVWRGSSTASRSPSPATSPASSARSRRCTCPPSEVAFAVGTVYLLGEVAGALFFGRLSDKWGRRNLFMITLGVYLFGGLLTR
jgi:hypothetical protein